MGDILRAFSQRWLRTLSLHCSLFFIHLYGGNLRVLMTQHHLGFQSQVKLIVKRSQGALVVTKTKIRSPRDFSHIIHNWEEYWWEPTILGNESECWYLVMAKVEAGKGKDLGHSLISATARRLFIIIGALKTNQLAICMEPASWMPRKQAAQYLVYY